MFVVCLLLASLNSCCNPWIYMAFSGNLVRQILPCCRRRHRRKQGQKRNHDLQMRHAKPHSKCNSSSAEKHQNRRLLLIAVDTADCPAKGDKSSRSSTSTKSTATLLPDAGRNSPTVALIRTNNHCESAPAKDTHTKTCECIRCAVAMTPRRLISCRRFSTKFKSKHEPALNSEDMKRSRCRRCNTSSYPSHFNSDLIEQKCTSI